MICFYIAPSSPHIVHVIPEYFGDTRLLNRLIVEFNELVSVGNSVCVVMSIFQYCIPG